MATYEDYPTFIQQKLAQDKSLRAAVDGTFSDFMEWFSDSKTPFFTEYTDHGPKHINEVLTTAVELIPEAAKELFSPQDAAILILAILLHDSAQHLSEAGFQELIKGSASERLIESFDTKTWPELWQDFLFSAMRWDEQQLIRVFGTTEPGMPRAEVHDPFNRYNNLTESDRRLIGEFIRRHHTRLAHEFSAFGIPGPSKHPLRLDQRLDEEVRDIAGFIARSHGLPLRGCIEYLINKYQNPRDYRKIHAVYLMTLLRVADYLQIQPGRIFKIAYRYRSIHSPVSQQEWKVHECVKHISFSHEDPESILIQALPEDVWTFLRLKEWLSGIQVELDESWAVLGELYGRYGPAPGEKTSLRDLGLTLRRVRSNITDTQTLARKVNYLPERIEFQVARSDLLKLLIRPLYGDHPEMGIRELMQNAVDAVRELQAWRERRGLKEPSSQGDQEDVEIWLDHPLGEGTSWITIKDRGIGMTDETIRDYFLTVGASFRQSDEWAREFNYSPIETEQFHGRSRVLRSGRFGVGVLAAFLLGSEIEVATRHVTSPKGLRFRTRLDSGPIELRYDSTIPIGTSIRIELPADIADSLSKYPHRWDWYCFDTPKIRRLQGRRRRVWEQEVCVPAPKDAAHAGWRKVSGQGLDAYVDTTLNEPRILICNGIKIANVDSLPIEPSVGRPVRSLRVPLLSFLDPDGKLPLNLQRTHLIGNLPLSTDIHAVLARTFLADLLFHAPSHFHQWRELEHVSMRLKEHVVPNHRAAPLKPWLFTTKGVTLIDPWNFAHAGIGSVLLLCLPSAELPPPSDYSNHDAVLYASPEDSYLEAILNAFFNSTTRGDLLNYHLRLSGLRVIMSDTLATWVMRKLAPEFQNSHGQFLKVEWERQGMTSIIRAQPPTSRLDPNMLTEFFRVAKERNTGPLVIGEWFLNPHDQQSVAVTDLATYWRDIIREPAIPFDLTERKARLVNAYESLSEEIEELRHSRRPS